MSTHGKYRLRTWLRGHLPALIAYQIPKGAQDCGCHAWYRRDDDWADCYHCEVGERRLAPGERVEPTQCPPTERSWRVAGRGAGWTVERDGEADARDARHALGHALRRLADRLDPPPRRRYAPENYTVVFNGRQVADALIRAARRDGEADA